MSNAIIGTLRALLPQPTLTVALVVQVHADQTSTVQYPDGSHQQAQGTAVSAGQWAWVRAGRIEGVAPAGDFTVIEV